MISNRIKKSRFKLYSNFFKIFAPFLVLTIIAFIFYIYLSTSNYRNDLIAESRLELGRAATALRNDISAAEEDIIRLSSMPELRQLMDVDYAQSKAAVEDILTNFLIQEEVYFKARIIDTNGLELSAVNYIDGRIEVLPDEELEDISGRTYFNNELTSLRGGVVYASELGLNIENGVVEEPYRPTIRYLISLYGNNRIKQGYIVLNFDAGRVLDSFRTRYDTGPADVSIVDSEGYFLSNPDIEMDWGFIFPERRDQTLRLIEPEVWSAIQNGDDIAFEAGGNYYQIAIWCGSNECIEREQGRGVLVQTVPYAGMNLPWIILSTLHLSDYLAPGQLIVSQFNSIVPVFLFLAFITFIAAFISWRYAKTIYVQELNEKNIRKNNALINAFFERNPDLMYLKDLAGTYVYANATLKKLFGLKEGEVIEGENNYKYMSPEMADKLKNQTEQVIKQKRSLEFYHAFNDGKEDRLYRSLKFPIYDDEKNLSYIGTIAADITEKMRAEDALRTSEARFRAIFDAAPDLIMLLDNKGYIKMVNHRAETNFIYPRKRIIDQHVSEILPLKNELVDHQSKKYLLKDVIDKIQKDRVTDAVRYDGSRVPVEVFFQAVTTDKKLMYVCVVRDITERVKALREVEKSHKELETLNKALEKEHELLEERVNERTLELSEAMQQAQAANQAKSAFLATMSHEIRTPMNGVVGSVDMLLQGNLGAKEKEQASIIKESAYSLLTIIDDVLDFSKIEAEKITLENQPVLLSYLVESICNAFIPIADKYKVRIRSYRDPDLPDTIIADPTRLRQIITNLLNNAIKFSSGRELQGEVSLRLENNQPGMLDILVEDNGIGISKESQRVIFNAFSQADSSTTRQFGGTGLGLPICQRLVELMEGQMVVESTIGKGSLFKCTIPIHADFTKTSKNETWLKGKTCYVLSRGERAYTDWQGWLEKAGATVAFVNSINELEECSPSEEVADNYLIFLNWLDSLDGYKALIKEKSLSKFKNIFILQENATDKIMQVDDQVFLLDQHPNIETCIQYLKHVIKGDTDIWQGKQKGGTDRIQSKGIPAEDNKVNKGHILLAEDNAINQKVAKSQLEFLGYTCEIANDGLEALEMLKLKNYDLLLTDLHMPRLDGLSLSKQIRMSEKAGSRYLPIMAFTADATKGEREKCIEAGMDAYISKPVILEMLGEKLKFLMNLQRSAENDPDVATDKAQGKVESTQRKLATFDSTVLAKILGSNEMVPEFLKEYMESASALKLNMLESFRIEDWEQLENIAHSLKSSSRSVGAMELGEICESLELAMQESKFECIKDLMDSFVNAFEKVIIEIESHLQGVKNAS